MINLTDKPVLNINGNVDLIIRDAIANVIDYHRRNYGEAPSVVSWKHPKHAFQWSFRKSSIKKQGILDQNFLFALFNLASLEVTASLGEYNKKISSYISMRPVPAHAAKYLKAGIKQLLVLLWSRGHILLPTTFKTGAHFIPLMDTHELHSYVSSFKADGSDKENGSKIQESFNRQMQYYMPRILYATNWRSVEDVSLYELAELHRAHRLFVTGKTSNATTTSPVPWTYFLKALARDFPSRINYKNSQLVTYSEWLSSGMYQEFPFSDYEKNRERIFEEKKFGEICKKRKLARQRKTSKQGGEVKRESRESIIFKRFREEYIRCHDVVSRHEAIKKFFKEGYAVRRLGFEWLKNESPYPGREHINVLGLSEMWRKSFEAYLYYRKTVKRYEKDKSVIGSLNILADYLFLYLPWWKELYPETEVEIPKAPKHFRRYIFVFRSSQDALERVPETFLQFVAWRRKTAATQRETVSIVERFFDFVESHYEDEDEIAGKGFRNPFSKQFDLPRVKRKSKTTKIPFKKHTYAYLVHYVYSIEAFGEYLQRKCLNEELDAKAKSLWTSRWLNASDFGFVPFFHYRGKCYRVNVIPNVFSWKERTFKGNGIDEGIFFVPHLTILRLLQAAIETGLRLMSLKWLDRRTWDKHNTFSSENGEFSWYPRAEYCFCLHVSTDKVKENAWETVVVHRVRSLLFREQKFQESIFEISNKTEVPYEKRESRFGNILPLFNSATQAGPVGDYSSDWLDLMVGFQEFYRVNLKEPMRFVKISRMEIPGRTEPKTKFTKAGNPYCALSITPVNTPHACRATYATIRSSLIESTDLAGLLGHDDPTVTEYYQRHDIQELSKRLEDADRKLITGTSSEEDVFIRADKDTSSLVKNFHKDREGTIQNFGFMPTATLWCSEDLVKLDSVGIELLRSGPMSSIIFRETHICPVGEECPQDVIRATGEPKRCGICPIAMKCIDHLPAISAKKNFLLERIKYLKQRSALMEKNNELAAADELWNQAIADTNEFIGWKASEEILLRIYRDKLQSDEKGVDAVFYHVDSPDIVKLHLKSVTRDSTMAEFMLARIIESDAYPTLQTPQVHALCARLSGKLLGARETGHPIFPEATDIKEVAALLKSFMRVKNIPLSDLAKILINEPSSVVVENPLLIEA